MALWLGPLRDCKERLTGKSGTILTRVRFPGAAIYFPEITFGADSLTVYVQFPVCNRMLQHLCARSKSQTLAATPFIVCTHEMGSAALATATAMLPEIFNNDKCL